MTQLDMTIIEWTTVAVQTGKTWDQLLEMEAAGEFPARIPGEHSQVWTREDVENWIRAREVK
jgi:predicted DNA-binding transcriptional regulator AlpA